MTHNEMARMVYDYFTSRYTIDMYICFRPDRDDWYWTKVVLDTNRADDFGDVLQGRAFETDGGWFSLSEFLEQLADEGVDEVTLEFSFNPEGASVTWINETGQQWPWEEVDAVNLSLEEFLRVFSPGESQGGSPAEPPQGGLGL